MAPMLDEAFLNDPDYIAEHDSRGTLMALATAGAQVREAVTLSHEAGIERVSGGD
jgi:glucose/mannose-6-phosphate isomerase